jgi:UDP-glucuronate 4-epimerase
MRVLVTDAAGFVGFHFLRRLAADGHEVHGAVTPGADPHLPHRRSRLEAAGLSLHTSAPAELVTRLRPACVVHLGLLPRDEHPETAAAVREAGADVAAWTELLAAAGQAGVAHVVLGSGAGVYGAGEKLPFAVDTPLDRPLGLRAAAQRSAELLGHAVAHAHGLSVTALRFFSVYGPFGQPTQAPLRFAHGLLSRAPVTLHEGGTLRRDFVYIDDAVEVLSRVVERAPEPPADAAPPFAVHNVGTGTPTPVARVLELVEAHIGRAAQRQDAPVPRTSLHHTWADVRELQQAYGFRPGTPLVEGVARTLDWLLSEEGATWRPEGSGAT